MLALAIQEVVAKTHHNPKVCCIDVAAFCFLKGLFGNCLFTILGSKGQRLTKTSSKTNGNDDFASRVNPKGQKSAPPPMPEKTKIHLKNDSSLGHQPKQKGRFYFFFLCSTNF